jgi:hypothetical protein
MGIIFLTVVPGINSYHAIQRMRINELECGEALETGANHKYAT